MKISKLVWPKTIAKLRSRGSEGRGSSAFPWLATKLTSLTRFDYRKKGSGSFRRKVALVVLGASLERPSSFARFQSQGLQLRKEVTFVSLKR